MKAFFDLEGPLSPQDNAYEVMGLIEGGHKVFEVLSRYDDILAMEGRENYEPGDTLKLLVPFLVYHHINSEHIEEVSHKARVVSGARELISELQGEGWGVYIISTSYREHAENIASQLGVDLENLACTELDLERYSGVGGSEIVGRVEKEILSLSEPGDREIEHLLDGFFDQLGRTELGRLLEGFEVVGGARKVEALKSFLRRDKGRLGFSVAVGDSITDFNMLQGVRGRGLAVVFNGNQYSLPHGDIAVASESLYTLKPLFSAFAEGGREKALEIGKEKNFALVEESDPDTLLEEHSRYREIVRGKASRLG